MKELVEVLECLELLSVQSAKVFKDKKVSIEDLQHVLPLLVNINVFVDAVKNIKEVPAELKDMDAQECVAVVTKIYEIVNAVKAELK